MFVLLFVVAHSPVFLYCDILNALSPDTHFCTFPLYAPPVFVFYLNNILTHIRRSTLFLRRDSLSLSLHLDSFTGPTTLTSSTLSLHDAIIYIWMWTFVPMSSVFLSTQNLCLPPFDHICVLIYCHNYIIPPPGRVRWQSLKKQTEKKTEKKEKKKCQQSTTKCCSLSLSLSLLLFRSSVPDLLSLLF